MLRRGCPILTSTLVGYPAVLWELVASLFDAIRVHHQDPISFKSFGKQAHRNELYYDHVRCVLDPYADGLFHDPSYPSAGQDLHGRGQSW